MKSRSIKLKYYLIVPLILMGSIAFAQGRFKKGEEFQRQVQVKSNCVLQRGSQALHVTSYSIIKKTYKSVDASERGASFTVSTDMLIDTVNAMDQNLVYNSNKPAGQNSAIQTGLQRLVNARPVVTVNNKGEILTMQRPATVSDTLLAFTGVQPENLTTGATLPFMVDFPVNPAFEKGYSWVNNTASTQTTYTIHAISAQTTTITYKTSVLGGSINSRVNGSMLISNDTGLILKCSSQTVSVGYEMVNGVVYAATRRTAITEVNVKK